MEKIMSNLYNLEDNKYIFETNPLHPSGGVYKRDINSHIHLVQTLKEKLKDELISGSNEDLYDTILRKFDKK